MNKPRIIIADSDINYIIPLQLKFVQDYFDQIELEVITDKRYFEALFSTPQKVDILIVSDEMYSPYLKKHDISNIFLMLEQYEEGATAELNVHCILKYSSIKEIFNEIVGKSAGVLKLGVSAMAESQIILVTAAKGGVGKTTVAMGMAACLSQNHKKVLYINASRLQMFQAYLGNQMPISAQDVYSRLLNPSDNIYGDIKHVIRYEDFYYLPAFKMALISLGIPFAVFEKIAVSAKRSQEYDVIIIDMDNTFDEQAVRLYDIADKVIVVTEQGNSAVYSTNVLVSNLNGINSDKYIFICNKYEKDEYNALIAPKMNVKFSINEYINRFESNGRIENKNLGEMLDIRKAAFLVV